MGVGREGMVHDQHLPETKDSSAKRSEGESVAEVSTGNS